MSRVTGRVDEVKAFPTKGGATMYSLIVDGARYGCGSVTPNCSVGDEVSFETIQKGEYVNINMRSLKVESKGSTSTASKAALQSASSGGYDARQDVISKQAAYNTAISFCALLNAAGAVPGVTAKTTSEQKFEILEALVEKKMQEFYSSSTGKDLPAASKSAIPKGTAKETSTQGEWEE